MQLLVNERYVDPTDCLYFLSRTLRVFHFFLYLLILKLACNYIQFRYSHRPISFYRSKGRRLVPNWLTIVPAGLDNTLLVHSEGCWSSVYEKQTCLPAQRNHLSIQPYTNSPERSNLFKSKYKNLCYTKTPHCYQFMSFQSFCCFTKIQGVT